MTQYSKAPFTFDGCAVCAACREADAKGKQLSADELRAVMRAANDEQAKKVPKKPKPSNG